MGLANSIIDDVVVTGLGLITPLGMGREQTWHAVLDGESGIERDPEDQDILRACVKKIAVPPELRLVSMGFLAASEALHDSRLLISPDITIGCTFSVSKPNLALSEKDTIRLSELFLTSTTGRQLYRIFKLNGPLRNIVAACATGTDSIIIGAQLIKRGLCDVVLAGGCESSLHPLYKAGFKQMHVLAKNTVAPFDKQREGFAMAEGAGALVIERKGQAMLRGATIYGRVSGYAMSNTVSDSIAMHNESNEISASIQKAIVQAGTDDIHYINAHGTATRSNDIIETRAIKQVFKEKAKHISISSTKAATGHLLGACGAVEAAFCLLAMRDQQVPPTLNLTHVDPECDLDYTPNTAKYKSIEHALSLSYGFGGQIGVIVLSKQ